jgi:hypothetical protein
MEFFITDLYSSRAYIVSWDVSGALLKVVRIYITSYYYTPM